MRPQKHLKRLVWMLALLLVTSTGISTAAAQTTCPSDQRCMSRERVEALVVAACAYDHEQAKRVEAVTRDLDRAETQRDQCQGQLAFLQSNPPPAPRSAPLWLRIALDVGVGALSAGTGTLAAVGAPSEVVVGFGVGAVGVLVSRLVLEVIQWR